MSEQLKTGSTGSAETDQGDVLDLTDIETDDPASELGESQESARSEREKPQQLRISANGTVLTKWDQEKLEKEGSGDPGNPYPGGRR